MSIFKFIKDELRGYAKLERDSLIRKILDSDAPKKQKRIEIKQIKLNFQPVRY